MSTLRFNVAYEDAGDGWVDPGWALVESLEVAAALDGAAGRHALRRFGVATR